MLVAKQGFSNKVEGAFGASIKSTFKSPEEWHQVGRAAATEHVKSLQRSSARLLPIKTGEACNSKHKSGSDFLSCFNRSGWIQPGCMFESCDSDRQLGWRVRPFGITPSTFWAACFRGTTYLGGGRLAMTCVP